MEYSFENIHSFTIPVITSPDINMPEGYGFLHEGSARTLQSYPANDFFLPVFLTKTGTLLDYVEVTHDDTIFVMQRQEVNPWFIEFAFFDTIKRNKVNEGADLTSIMINYIRSVRPDVANLIDADVKKWFDSNGQFELPWNKGSANETDLDDLDKISLIYQNIISKAHFLNITVNK